MTNPKTPLAEAPIPDHPLPDWSALRDIPIVERNDPLLPTSLSPGLATYPPTTRWGFPMRSTSALSAARCLTG